ncbi:glutathione S-transferase T3-like [Rosa rugosa]|uniref:glutathione S-transferase T3-like n=1 Tax=Rosa rugosa TaxID=74645 RepID=UPI002B40CA9C|nr:glutathione S-transferase T3-like [Rosa rugosa]
MDSMSLNFTELINSETNRNEPPLTYDFPSSQYHTNGSTCAPIPFEDCTYEETLTNEDCTNKETTCAPGSKKAQRQANFTVEEDKLLISAWLNVSIDQVKGADQKKKQFWKRITKYFEDNKKWSGERSEKSLTNRWSKINTTVSKFYGHHSQIEHLQKSDYTEQDKIVEAKEMFQKKEGHTFVLDHCWAIMRFQQKWMDEHQKINAKRKFKAPDSINLEDDDVEGPEPAPLQRPIGRKAAKEVIKKAKSKEQVSENETPSKSTSKLEEFMAKKLESERIRAEQFKLLLDTEQKQVALREKEIEIQLRSEDAKIMAMDTSVMPPIQAEYFIGLQKEILAKRASGGGNQVFLSECTIR